MHRIALVLLFIALTARIQPPIAAQPTVSQSYGLTMERDDFVGSQGVVSPTGQVSFSSAVPARSSFVLVFRNGLLQRSGGATCPVTPPAPCDYATSGNLTITYPPMIINADDLVTLIFQR